MTYPTPEGSPQTQIDYLDTWFQQGFAEDPTMNKLLDQRANQIETALMYFTAEENNMERPTLPETRPLSELGQEAKKLLYLFTTPGDFNDRLNDLDVAGFVINWYIEAEGDPIQLVERVRQFNRNAHDFYLPWLQASIPNWEELYQWQKFWAVFGAMHMKDPRLPV